MKIDDLNRSKVYFINFLTKLKPENISIMINRKYNIPTAKYQIKSFSKTFILLYKTSALILSSLGIIFSEYLY